MKNLIKNAEKFATMAHKGQTRRDKITPYIEHPRKVVKILKDWGVIDPVIIASAWLHDVVEDTKYGYIAIARVCGGRVADNVHDLTKITTVDKVKDELRYVEQLKFANDDVKLIKLADVIANLTDLGSLKSMSKQKKQKYINKKKMYLRAIL
jgi:guanosine-3',5'-bis(diphosphate) 3'-pyrophosphohydrolase